MIFMRRTGDKSTSFSRAGGGMLVASGLAIIPTGFDTIRAHQL
jgi:hypothetical protein